LFFSWKKHVDGKVRPYADLTYWYISPALERKIVVFSRNPEKQWSFIVKKKASNIRISI
jgi:hypothetical protein